VARETEEVDVTTGEISTTHAGIWLGELVHRGLTIKNKLHQRAQYRRGRRSRTTRYRAPRFDNRRRRPLPGMGVWLAPSTAHRVVTTSNWVGRLARWYPVTGVWVEDVRFDTQQLLNPEITGAIYQQGELAGYEVREYLLEKFGRTCVYCDATDVPLNIDHVHPKSRGGSDRVSNLALACIACNQAKSSRPVEEFVTDPTRLARVLSRVKRPLRDAAAVKTTRTALTTLLRSRGFVAVSSTGGRTKFNRTRSGMPKSHALDALAVGPIDHVGGWPGRTQVIRCAGRGRYRRTTLDRFGFPRGTATRKKRAHGFATGDLVRAVVPAGKKAGTHTGRVAVRARGSFNITTAGGIVRHIHHRHVRLIQRADGYTYTTTPAPERR
jgi:5-methylcytosine-specific restriction endonuclease McrA